MSISGDDAVLLHAGRDTTNREVGLLRPWLFLIALIALPLRDYRFGMRPPVCRQRFPYLNLFFSELSVSRSTDVPLVTFMWFHQCAPNCHIIPPRPHLACIFHSREAVRLIGAVRRFTVGEQQTGPALTHVLSSCNPLPALTRSCLVIAVCAPDTLRGDLLAWSNSSVLRASPASTANVSLIQ